MATTIEQQLERLGDPSGQQISSYWDDWFQIVCSKQEYCSFEWYCSPEEVTRILLYHTVSDLSNNDDNQLNISRTCRKMIHPGSGTSLLPIKLRSDFPQHCHIILDISAVAIEKVKNIHEQQSNSATQQNYQEIEYHVLNVLEPPLTILDASSFEFWIDKGFLDAVFAKNQLEKSHEQARNMFQECNRLLTEEADSTLCGKALIVSLAEDHSLQLILEPWLNQPGWSKTLHIWELNPISGMHRPFGFVLTKAVKKQSISIATTTEDNQYRHLVWHFVNDVVEETVLAIDDVASNVQTRISLSRQAFVAMNSKKLTKEAHLLVTLDIKPCDAETNLLALSQSIRTAPWDLLSAVSPNWQSINTETGEVQEILPIGYGISKLRLSCILSSSDEVDSLVAILEEGCASIDFCNISECIQSVDVESTVFLNKLL